jgi:hypothetical protein
MPAILFKFLGPFAPYLAAAGALLGAALYVMTLRQDLTNANQKNMALAQANQADTAAIADYKAQQASWNTALNKLDAQTIAASTATAHIVDSITAAPAGDDAPVAPVLSHALDSLRAVQGASP